MENTNENIIKALSDSLYAHLTYEAIESDFVDYVSTIKQRGRTPDIRKLGNQIIQELPWPIGIELARLFSVDCREYDERRVNQLLRLGEKATAFFSYILVAQLWDESKKRKLQFNNDFLEQFKNFDKPSFGVYGGLIRSVHTMFDDNSIEPFTLHNHNPNFVKNKFLKTLFQIIDIRNAKVHGNIMATRCKDLENLIIDFLTNLGFLARYKLISIQSIYIYKPRLIKPKYRHVLQYIAGEESAFSGGEASYSTFTESPSVLLLKNENADSADFMASYINLSPFVVDTKGQLKGAGIEGIKEGTYLYYQTKNETPFYNHISTADEAIALNEIPAFEQLDEEFADLKNSFTP